MEKRKNNNQKNNKVSIWKKIPQRVIIPLCFSVICSLFVYTFVKFAPYMSTWFGLIADTTAESYMKAYYNTMNKFQTEADSCKDIIILSVREDLTRQDIGDLIYYISTCSPKAIGVDCTFAPSRSFDSVQTNYLIQKISAIPDSFPITYAYVEGEPSVIPDSIISQKHKGNVSFIGFYDYCIFQDSTPHLAVQLAQIAGYKTQCINTSSFLVNYRTKQFVERQIYSDDLMDEKEKASLRELVQNKFVIIGGLYDPLDTHWSPFYIENENNGIAGTKIVAYALSSILSATIPNYSKYYWVKNAHYHHYVKLSLWANTIWTIFLSLIYILVYAGIDRLQKKWMWAVILKPLWLFLTIVIVLLTCIVITANTYYVPNMVFFIFITSFVGFSYDICNNERFLKKMHITCFNT